ncbi:MAG: Na+/H+ antiporter [Gemmatimonadetes bacterium]|nr:Na+/H+ antiporter [Gemmatimonadota bacterium]
MRIETTLILLFSIATAVALAVRAVRFPYTVALVLVGLALGSLGLVPAPHLTKDLLFAVFLPGLLFEASFNINAREFWASRLTVGALAVPGVVAAIALTALLVTGMMTGFALDRDFTWRHGMVFGALIAATDPIAVVALFKQMHVGHRLTALVEAESLLNDGTSVVFFTLILAYVGGESPTPGSLSLQFLYIVGGGLVIGALLAALATHITARIDDPVIEIALTVIAAYGSFALAEEVHCSGVIATVTAGMLCGTFGRERAMTAPTRLAVATFWDYLAFALNSFVFLLIGFEVELPALAVWAPVIGVAWLGALVGRFGVVFLVTAALRGTRERVPSPWVAVLTWGGLRGALSMVLALSLPADFPHRSQLIAMTYGVVLLSLVLQGLSMPWLIRRLKVGHSEPVDIAVAEVTSRA